LLILALISSYRYKLLILREWNFLLLSFILISLVGCDSILLMILLIVLFDNDIICKLVTWAFLSFFIFELLKIIFSERSYFLIINSFIQLLMMCLLVLMYKLLLIITHLILSTNNLPRVVNLIIVMIIFLLINTLRWLPTSWFALVATLSISISLWFMLHHFIVVWII